MSMDVGAHLKAVRQMYGLSQRELAKRAGVTNGLISLIEQNRVSPSVSSLKKVLDGIPMALADFFTLDLRPSRRCSSPRAELAGHRAGASSCGWSAAAGQAQHVDPARALRAERRYRRGNAHARGREGGVIVKGKIELGRRRDRACSGPAMLLLQELAAASLPQCRARGMRDRERQLAAPKF
jgi:transcriptional regulator with XRE-family HTH domain